MIRKGDLPWRDVPFARVCCESCLRGSPFAAAFLRVACPTIAPKASCDACGRLRR